MWIKDPFLGSTESIIKPAHPCHYPSYGPWIVKIKNTGINEVAAYQLATHLAVPVPESRWFILEDDLPIFGTSHCEGSVGMLIKQIENPVNEDLATVASVDAILAGRILAYFCFDRQEWGEIIRGNGKINLIDLEFMLASYAPTSASRKNSLKEYAELSEPFFTQYASQEAVHHEITTEFHSELKRFFDYIEKHKVEFDFHPHPQKKTIESYFLRCFQSRAEVIRNCM